MAVWMVTFDLQESSYSDFLLFLFVHGKSLSVHGEDNVEADLPLCICP